MSSPNLRTHRRLRLFLAYLLVAGSFPTPAFPVAPHARRAAQAPAPEATATREMATSASDVQRTAAPVALQGTGGNPTLRADYQFQNTFDSSVAGAPALTNLGSSTNSFVSDTVGGVSRTVLDFPLSNGVQLAPTTGVVPNDAYTIAVLFRFNDVSGYRKIVDFKNGVSDSGFYNLNGSLNFFPIVTGPGTPISPNTYVQAVITRDAAKNVIGYVNGVQQFSFVDSSDLALIDSNNTLRFFRDDDATGARENSAGAVSRIRLFDGALAADQVAALSNYDAVSNFSIANNPNGVWSYGYTTPNASFIRDTDARVDAVPGIDTWRGNISGDGNPGISHNKTSNTITYGTITHPPDVLNLHPGPNGERCVTRWTAPAAGTYRINGRFEGLDSTSTDVAILRNSTTSLFGGNVNGFGTRVPFDVTVTVATGDTIDFSVGFGGNGFSNDSTGLAATLTFVGTRACTPPPSGMVAWYPGDGNANDIQGGNNGALQNGATFAPGEVGQAFSLDGVDDQIFIGNPTSLRITGDLTIDAWVNPVDVTEGQLASIVTKWGFDGTTDSYGLWLTKQGGVIQLFSALGDAAGSGDSGFAGGTLAPNTQAHVAMTYQASNGLHTLYVNGQQVAQRTRTGGIRDTNTNVLIGREGSSQQRPFNGLIDEVEIFNRALSQAEIQPIVNAGSAGKCKTGVTPTPTPTPSADLSVSISDAPDPVVLGSDLTYTIPVVNNGPATATNVTLTDTLPSSVTFVSASTGCTQASSTITCNLGALNSGSTSNTTITVRPNAAGTISNTASVAGTETDPDTSNNSATASTVVNGSNNVDPSVQTTLQGGGSGGSQFFIQNVNFGAITAANFPAGNRLTVLDASIGCVSNVQCQGDAYDGAYEVTVGGALFAAPNPSTLSNGIFTAGPVSLSGLNVTQQYSVAQQSATLRTLLSLQNPGSAAATVPVEMIVELGSDGGTVNVTSSSGDTVLTTADRYLITDDSFTSGDPANTTVFYGPGTIALPPSALVQTGVGRNSGPTEVLKATFNVSVPAGATRRLLFFGQLNHTAAEAQAAATAFDSTPTPDGDLLRGLSSGQLAEIVNFDFTGAQPQPSLSINDVTVTEGNSGTTDAVFNVTLSSASSQNVTVNFATADGTATAGSDYSAATGTLTFLPGEISKTIRVSVNGDTLTEGDETFFVNLSNAVGATINDGQGVGTIANDDLRFGISGRIINSARNSGVDGVIVTLSGAQSATAATDSNGDYSFADLAAGGNYTVTPSRTNFTFAPASQTFNNLSSNQAGNFIGTEESSVATPVGTNVTVLIDDLSLNFASVSAAGITTVRHISLNSIGTPPTRYTFFSNEAIDITTTAAVSAPITLCGTESQINDPAVFASLRVLHGENGTLVDRTSSSDFATRRICATVTSLSPFVLATVQTQTISGRVSNSGGAALAGVTMTLSGTQSLTTTTDANGNYSFTVTQGGNYTVTPALTGFTFTPPNQTFNNLIANGQADFTGASNAQGVNNYIINQSTGGVIVPGTTDIGNHCDDCVTPVTLPFPVSLYDRVFNTATITSNGIIEFTGETSRFSNGCLPDSDQSLNYTILGYFDDLRTDAANIPGLGPSGIFTSVTGTAPNRVFNVEWRSNFFNSNNQFIHFEIRLFEGQQRFDVIYDRIDQFGNGATVGVQRTATTGFTQYECNTGGLTPGLQLTFTGSDQSFISGLLTEASGAGISGATITLGGSSSATATTDASGFYSFNNLTPGGNYTVTPSAPSFAFTPLSRAFNNFSGSGTANFVGTRGASTFTVNGNIRDTGGGLSGVTVTLGGSSSATTTTDASGNYSFANLAGGGNYSVTPTRANFTFAPASATFNNLSANQTANFTGTRTTFTISGRVAEAGGVSGVGGVTLTLGATCDGDALQTAISDANGNYAFTINGGGGDFCVAAARAGFILTPPRYSFMNLAANQIANFSASGALTIRGQVTNLPAGTTATVTLSGTRSAVIETDAGGNYLFTTLTPGGNYRITPQSDVLTFDPPNTVLNNLTADATANFGATVIPGPTPTPTPISDDFEAGQRDPEKFNLGTLTRPPGSTDPQVTVVQQQIVQPDGTVEGKLVITPRSNIAGSSFNGYVTTNSIDFNGGIASLEVDQVASGGAQTAFSVGDSDQSFFRFVVQDQIGAATVSATTAKRGGGVRPAEASTLRQMIFQVRDAGFFNDLSIPYDAVQMRYWRFRHDVRLQTMNFETSPTGVEENSWTIRFARRLASALGRFSTEINAGTDTVVANPGQAIFDKLNITPSQTRARVGGFAFANSAVTVGEGAGSVTLTVRRSGSTSGEAVVAVTSSRDGQPCAVSDGTARPRCDFSTISALLRFAPGETEKSVTIFINDDSYVEGTERFNVTLGPATSGYVVETPIAVVTITDNDTAGAANPIDSAPFFVRQQYLDFLNREPDPSGFNAWVGVLTNCAYEGHFGPGKSGTDPLCDRLTVSSGFFRSQEFLTRGYFIYRFYDVALGRLPTYEEFLADFQRLSGPQTLAQQEANKVAFVNEFVGRAEFRSLYGDFNNAQNFDALLRRASGQLRPPNTVVLPNRDALVASLVAGRRTPAQTLRDVIESPQVSARFLNRGFVTMQYFGYMQRDPEEPGFSDNLRVLDDTGDFRNLINGFVNSVEYQLRFGPVQ